MAVLGACDSDDSAPRTISMAGAATRRATEPSAGLGAGWPDARSSTIRSRRSNFLTRLAITASFVLLAVTLTGAWLVGVAAGWGLAVLGVLTVSLAHQRQAPVRRELIRHYAIAVAVILLSRLIGNFVSAHVT